MNPPDDLKARVLSAAKAEASPVRRIVERRRRLAWLGAGTWVLAFFGGLGGLRAVDRPLSFVLETAAGWTAVAAVATWTVSRGASMLGRPRRTLVAVVGAAPLALFAWYAGCVGGGDFAVAVWPLSGSVRCAGAVLAMALAPLAVLVAARRRTVATHPRATGAALGVVSGGWAAVLIDLHCEHADLLHVTLGHVLPTVVCAAIGLAAGGWLAVGPWSDERDPLARGSTSPSA